jgi:hypothetical protein
MPSETGPDQANDTRLLYIDIAKTILIYSFLVAHSFRYSLYHAVYWNTGCFVILSGYIIGKFKVGKPLSVSSFLTKAFKINLWIFIYILSIWILHYFRRVEHPFLSSISVYSSVLEFIAIFYLLLPILSTSSRPGRLAFWMFISILAANYIAMLTNGIWPGHYDGTIKLLIMGSDYSADLTYYPLLSFANLGFLGLLYAKIEEKQKNILPISITITALLYIVMYLNEATHTGIMTERFPPLVFYSLLSLSIFSLIIEISKAIEDKFLKHDLGRYFIFCAKYSVAIFVFHDPLISIVHKFFPDIFAVQNYFKALLISIVFSLGVVVLLCLIFLLSFEKMPRAWQKKLF